MRWRSSRGYIWPWVMRRAALAATRRATGIHRRHDLAPLQGMTPALVWWEHSRALKAARRAADARKALERAYEFMRKGIASVSDEGLRRNYLNKIEWHREIIGAWLDDAVTRGLAPARRAAHLVGEASLREPFERLVDTGLRLNELRSATELHEFLIDEVTELSGAERVLLVLETPAGLQLAGSLVPQGEDAQALLADVMPALLAVRRARAVSLEHTPEGAPELRQRSRVIAPLIAQRELLGYLYADLDGAYGRLRVADRDLLGMLASQAAVALDNARWSQGLEQKVTQRTEELRASNALLEQRANELAIINSIQEGMAAELDFQAIVDLVGEKLREVFNTGDIGIRLYDEQADVVRYPYEFEHGRRLTQPPREPTAMFRRQLADRQPIFGGSDEIVKRFNLTVAPGTDMSKAIAMVPIIAGDRVIGNIKLESFEREDYFNVSNIRLLQTIAASMGVALENARLWNETQEALERETASNDILRVIAESPTDVRPVLDVIARHAARISGSDDAIIGVHEGDTLLVAAHHGDIPMIPVGQGIRFNRDSIAGRAMIDGVTLQTVHAEPGAASEYPEGDAIAQKYGYRVTCAVPLLREGEVVGVIGIRRIKPELLDDDQIAVIRSFASQAAIAIGNVRLFDETQRLLKETEQRAAELAVINSIQQGMAGSLDFQTIVDLVGDKVRELFDSADMGIQWLDEQTGLIHFLYAYEHGKRLQLPPMKAPVGKRYYEALRARQTVRWNSHADYPAWELEAVEGTDASRSGVAIPIFAGDRLRGFIMLENYERDNAFGDADVRLLGTVAAGMGVALENARLFDETQRLLKETERRSSELAVINSIQQGMAAELNFQAIVDLVGDKLRELFNTGDIGIRWRDEKTELVHHLYVYEHGQRLSLPPSKYNPDSKLVQALLKGAPVVSGTRPNPTRLGIKTIAGTDSSLSSVFLPIFVGDRLARLARAGELRARGRLQRGRGEAPEHGRVVDGRGARERAPARGDAAPRARGVGAGRGGPRPVVVARSRHRDGPHRRPCEGPAAGRQQRDLRAGSGDHDLPRDRRGRRRGRCDQGHGDRRRHGHHRQHRAERPARARQRRRSRPARACRFPAPRASRTSA